MSEPIMKRAKGDGVGIQLAQWPGTGDHHLFCVHGLTANCRCWDLIANELSPDVAITAMDLRGRGQSDKPDQGYAIDRHVADISAVLDDLGLTKTVIMGHSLGAFIALAFAAAKPERTQKVVLVDGGGVLSPEQSEKVFAGIKPSLDRLGQVFPSTDAYLDLMKQSPFFKPWSPTIEAYFRYEIETCDGGVRSVIPPAAIIEEAANLNDTAVDQYYPQVRCPVLILRAPEGMLAADDILLPQASLDGMLKEISKARCVDLPGKNHYSIIFHDDDMRRQTIRRFLGAQ